MRIKANRQYNTKRSFVMPPKTFALRYNMASARPTGFFVNLTNARFRFLKTMDNL